MIDYVTVSDTPPYSQPEPYICLSLTNLHLLKMHKPIYKQAFTGNDIPTPKFFQIFTYGSEVDEKDAAAVVSSVAPNNPTVYLHHRAARNPICYQTGIPVSGK